MSGAPNRFHRPVAASKCYETAASIAKEAKLNKDAADLYESASYCMRETGISEKAAQLLVLAAKCVSSIPVYLAHYTQES